ncbi:MAG: leucyl aminopeptidase [Chloroflexi bacterium]|nr:leucyl aminopeptidase [Chloroflexota bacterium]
MELKVQTGDITTWKGDGIVVNLFEGAMAPDGGAGAVDKKLRGVLTKLIKRGEIKGKLGSAAMVHTFDKLPADRVCVVGLGKQGEFTLDRARQAAAAGVKALRNAGAKKIASVVHGAGSLGNLDPESAAQANAEGIILGLWQFRKYFSDNSDVKTVDEVVLLERDPSKLKVMKAGAARGEILAHATNLARDLTNEPGNAMTPTHLAQIAKEIAKKNGLEYEVIDRDKAKKLGMGAFLGVAQGSDEPPYIIILRYLGGGKKSAPGLGLIGKAITFDSGGISLKPSEGMQDMKGDMAGGAAVLAAMQAIGQLQPAINVTGIVAATENLPSGKAFKPGDILKASNGKTIEIISTDAEGRLVLADALVYATKTLKLAPVVDAATLTGAMVVALGHHRTGVFSNDKELTELLAKIGEETGEKNWAMPMDPEYAEQIKSEWADLKNSGGRPAGSIIGALFLKHFVGETAWAHLDIAGSVGGLIGANKENGYKNKFGNGTPTRTFVHLALALAGKK